jgi:putative transposase
MPRIMRGLVDGLTYHILNRGNGGQAIFHKEGDYKAFIELMKEAKGRNPIKIFAYCLMPNHFHLILHPEHAQELSKWMQWLMTSHVRRYHRHYNSSGHVWQGRYKSFVVQEDSYLLALLRYVEGNPLRAGLVGTAKDWPWSSCRERIGENYHFIDQSPIDLPENWDKYINEPLGQNEIEEVRRSVNRQAPYGSLGWQKKIAREIGVESTLRSRGRPRKNN